MSTPGAYHNECGVIMSTTGVLSTRERYLEYTGGFWCELWKSRYQISTIFVLALFATMQLDMLAFETDSWLKFSHQAARAHADINAFLVSCLIKCLVVSKCPVCMLLQGE